MIYLAKSIIDSKVISISQLGVIGSIVGLLVDPYRLTVAGFWVQENNRSNKRNFKILLALSVRQIDKNRFFVNDVDDLSSTDELPKLKDILEIDYQMPKKPVVSTNNKKIGLVEDFAFSEDDYKIVYILVKSAFYKNFKMIHQRFNRSQIENISQKNIKVKTGRQKQSIASETLPI